jgi:uncharacterized protein (DUF1778 family)
MSYGSDLVEEASNYILQHNKEDEQGRLNLSISAELVTLIAAIAEKTGQTRSFVVEQLLYHSISHFQVTAKTLL